MIVGREYDEILRIQFEKGCTGLTTLPDLSVLGHLDVKDLPEALQQWQENGRKAFQRNA